MRNTGLLTLDELQVILKNTKHEDLKNVFGVKPKKPYSKSDLATHFGMIHHFNKAVYRHRSEGSMTDILRKLLDKGLLYHEYLRVMYNCDIIIPIYSLSEK